MPKVTIISYNGIETEAELPDGKNVVEYANEIIGWVEVISLPGLPGKVMLVDEDGKSKGLLLNNKATEIAGQRILGKVIICNVRLLG